MRDVFALINIPKNSILILLFWNVKNDDKFNLIK